MKKSFLLSSIFSALLFFLCCGCKDSSLHYVSPGAQYVVYGDLAKLTAHKFWKSFSRLELCHRYVRSYLEPLHLSEEDLAGNFAFWGAGQEMNGMVIVLQQDAAGLMKKILALQQRQKDTGESFIQVKPVKCLDHDALVLNDSIFIVQSNTRTLQIFLGEPLALHLPSRKSKMAGMIDENALFAIAVSDGVLRNILDIQEELPSSTLLQIHADDRKVSLEANWNIENMRDPFPLLKFLEH